MPSPGADTAARVLIVDDDAAVSGALSRSLRLEGCEVWSAPSADQGLALACTHTPDAVILDLRTPLANGVSFLRRVRAIPGLAGTPVAIVTSDYHRDDGLTAEIRALGGELRYKPVWLQELLTLVRELLRSPVRD